MICLLKPATFLFPFSTAFVFSFLTLLTFPTVFYSFFQIFFLFLRNFSPPFRLVFSWLHFPTSSFHLTPVFFAHFPHSRRTATKQFRKCKENQKIVKTDSANNFWFSLFSDSHDYRLLLRLFWQFSPLRKMQGFWRGRKWQGTRTVSCLLLGNGGRLLEFSMRFPHRHRIATLSHSLVHTSAHIVASSPKRIYTFSSASPSLSFVLSSNKESNSKHENILPGKREAEGRNVINSKKGRRRQTCTNQGEKLPGKANFAESKIAKTQTGSKWLSCKKGAWRVYKGKSRKE